MVNEKTMRNPAEEKAQDRKKITGKETQWTYKNLLRPATTRAAQSQVKRCFHLSDEQNF